MAQRARQTVFPMLIAGILLLASGTADAAATAEPRPAAELIPEASRLFLEIDVRALREKGPPDAVQRALTALAPMANNAGLSTERLRTIVMANGEEPMSGDRLPSWLLFVQDGAAPSVSRLESTFRSYYSKPALKPGSMQGVAYRGNRELSLMELPGGMALVAGAAGPRAIVEAWQGKSATPLVRAPRAELLRRVSGSAAGDHLAAAPSAPAIRFWLTLSAAMQRSLVDDAQLPAVPLEVALAVRMLADHGAELSVLARCSDEETSKRMATWLSARLTTLATLPMVQMMGLAGYVKACKVKSDGASADLQLALTGPQLTALLEQAMGMAGSVAPRDKHPPAGAK